MRITDRQKAFITAFVACGVVKDSAMKAGYKKSGASSAGNQLMNKPHVVNEIKRLQHQAATNAGLTIEETINNARMSIKLGHQDGNLNAANQANSLLVEIGGYKKPTESTQTHVSIDLTAKLAQAEKRIKAIDVTPGHLTSDQVVTLPSKSTSSK